jgi:glutaconate CoA-transferase subunit B
VGVASPVASAGMMLASRLHAPKARYNVPGMGGNYFKGSHEISGFAQGGKLDLFFLSAAQIDASCNINLQYIGDPDHPAKRFPGAFAAPVYYYVMGRTVLFRNQHTPRIFVPKVDFITAGSAAVERQRRIGWPGKVVTPLAVLAFNRETGLLELESFHAGQSIDSVQAATGFELPLAAGVHETPEPTPQELDLMQGDIRTSMRQSFPSWAAA